MKVGAGGLQVQTVHDEVANRQAQESRRTDYLQKPVNDSDNTEALNRNALNKTVERPNDAAEPFDLPLRRRDEEKEHGRGGAKSGEENDERKKSGADEDIITNDKTGPFAGLKVDRYI